MTCYGMDLVDRTDVPKCGERRIVSLKLRA